jgi:hypothetical protein
VAPDTERRLCRVSQILSVKMLNADKMTIEEVSVDQMALDGMFCCNNVLYYLMTKVQVTPKKFYHIGPNSLFTFVIILVHVHVLPFYQIC